jgi:hypothetical protein
MRGLQSHVRLRRCSLLLAGVVVLAAGGCTSSAQGAGCAAAIGWRDAASSLGTIATVRGPVVDAHFASIGQGQPTFLDIGRPYPDPDRFSVVIWGRDRGNFAAPPEQTYRGRTICVSGLIDTASGTAGIEVTSPAAIVFS